MFQTQLRSNKKGVSVIELLVVVTIIGLGLGGLLQLTSFSLSAFNLSGQSIRALNLAKEITEALRNFRDGTIWNQNGLGVLTTGQNYYLQESGGVWQSVSGLETIGIFTRRVILEDVMRDTNSNIVAAGGALDQDTKKAATIVSWQEKGRNHQVELTVYLTNWK